MNRETTNPAAPREDALAEAIDLLRAYAKHAEDKGGSSYAAHVRATARDLAALLTPQAAQPVAVDWQPIETAPKDGSLFLGCMADYYHPQEVCWAAYHPNAKGKECWRTAHICGNKVEGLTHWMPLPSPPTPKDTP